jgi:hypothetical protein
MRKTLFTLLIIVLSIGHLACSSNWKEGSSGISTEEVMEDLSNLSTAGTSGLGSGRSLYNSLLENENTLIYYARSGDSSNGGVGPAYSLLSLSDFSLFMNTSNDEEISALDLETSKAALLMGTNEDGETKFVLAITFQFKDEQQQTVILEDLGFEFSKNRLRIHFESLNGNFMVETYDIVEGKEDLESKIHLNIIQIQDQKEKYIGQISILEGFSI